MTKKKTPKEINAKEAIEELQEQVESLFKTEEFEKIAEGVQQAYKIISAAFNSMAAFVPFVSAELKERGLTMADIRNIKDKEERERLGGEIIRAAKERALKQKTINGEEVQKALIEFVKPDTVEQADILKAITPLSHVSPNNPLMNDLSGGQGHKPINAGAYDLPVIKEDKKKRREEITNFVMVTYDEEKGITSNLSEYERSVSDAICSVWEEAEKTGMPPAFDLDGIYKAMPGGGARITPQQEKELQKTIEKFTEIKVDYDATDELRKRGKIGDNEEYHVKERYLQVREHQKTIKKGTGVKGKGITKTVWEITSEPLVLKTSKLTKQIVSAPARNIQIEEVNDKGEATGQPLKMSTARKTLVSYYFRRVAVILKDYENAAKRWRDNEKRRKKDPTIKEKPLQAFRDKSDTILFETAFKETDNDTSNAVQINRNKNFSYEVFNYWKAIGYIKDYTKKKEGKNAVGIVIVH